MPGVHVRAISDIFFSSNAVTDPQGAYAIPLQAGSLYSAVAWTDLQWNGAQYHLPLYPSGGTTDGQKPQFTSTLGFVQDFVWRLSGLKLKTMPAGDPASYFGAALLVFNTDPTPPSAGDKCGYQKRIRPTFPTTAGSVVKLTLVPAGRAPMVDGGGGGQIRFAYTILPVPAGAPLNAYCDAAGSQIDRGAGGQIGELKDFMNIPIGLYTVTATVTAPGGGSVPLQVTANFNWSCPGHPPACESYLPLASAPTIYFSPYRPGDNFGVPWQTQAWWPTALYLVGPKSAASGQPPTAPSSAPSSQPTAQSSPTPSQAAAPTPIPSPVETPTPIPSPAPPPPPAFTACTNLSFLSDSPQPAGTTGASLAASVGSCSSALYQFSVTSPSGVTTVVQPWSTTNAFIWDTTGLPAGDYAWQVQAREPSDPAVELTGTLTYTLT
jgi:hypothetical protein